MGILAVHVAGAIIGLCLVADTASSEVGTYPEPGCAIAPSKQIIEHQPFALNDPRTGLILYLESDRRHMTAKTRGGRIVWQRNLFCDPRLQWELGPPSIQLPGEPPLSKAKFRQQRHAIAAKLYIDRIGVVSDCEAHLIDRNRVFRGHYIRAGSGTKYEYLIDAKTGDFLIGEIN
jgi:hypothetical protein